MPLLSKYKDAVDQSDEKLSRKGEGHYIGVAISVVSSVILHAPPSLSRSKLLREALLHRSYRKHFLDLVQHLELQSHTIIYVFVVFIHPRHSTNPNISTTPIFFRETKFLSPTSQPYLFTVDRPPCEASPRELPQVHPVSHFTVTTFLHLVSLLPSL